MLFLELCIFFFFCLYRHNKTLDTVLLCCTEGPIRGIILRSSCVFSQSDVWGFSFVRKRGKTGSCVNLCVGLLSLRASHGGGGIGT